MMLKGVALLLSALLVGATPHELEDRANYYPPPPPPPTYPPPGPGGPGGLGPGQCRCIPGETCWPTAAEWQAFNKLVKGALIKSVPTAQSCYAPHKDLDECAYVNKMWSDQDFQTTRPIGRPYPYNITCAPVDYASGQVPTTCVIGTLPVYAVNATTRDQIKTSLAYVQKRNLRLAVASTGHDLLGRSDGFGSLEIWLRYYRNSISFQQTYTASDKCTKSGWKGSALKIDGAYQWRDVYDVAKAHNVIVVGGGSPSPCAIGGWPSGGGHGPASRNYGLGADQILEAEVMLADGSIITVNACQHADLFKAIRGGGPGYGITLSTTIKAYPNVKVVTAHHLAIAPLHQTPKNADLLDAVALMLTKLPDLNDAGYAGYGYWFRNFPGKFIGDYQSGYTHGFWTIGKDQKQADAAFAPVRKALAPYKDRLFIHEDFKTYTDYWSFYKAESGLYDPVGDTSLLTSRLIDRPSVSDRKKVRDAVEVLSGKPEEYASNVILLVSGGKNFDTSDKTSGLNPAWRKSNFALITGQGIPRNASQELRQAVTDEITYVKGAAGKKLAPNTGGYMNEGNRHDPNYIQDFYGSNYQSHLAAKRKYDPTNVFFCPSCVGSEFFVENSNGKLCRK